MMLIHPFDVPEMMWFPNAEKMVTQVDCLASWAARLAAAAGSISSLSGRKGAVGRIRLTGVLLEISTRTGWSSKSEATKRRLKNSESKVSHLQMENGRKRKGCAVLVKWMQLRNIHWCLKSDGVYA